MRRVTGEGAGCPPPGSTGGEAPGGPWGDGVAREGAEWRDAWEGWGRLPRAEQRRLERLARQARRLALTLERMRIAEFVRLTEKPRHLFYVNFLAGLGRGVGIAVGFSLLGALLLYFLRRAVMLHLPGIGTFIAELVMIVQSQIRP
ncbi:MAG: DUF5665 domain-containing protein [Acetobacteraceae bacterium]|nr:DUF5665 domain-containing protein [Acetobacteraceae bacterium]